jgi:hypothetical protein
MSVIPIQSHYPVVQRPNIRSGCAPLSERGIRSRKAGRPKRRPEVESLEDRLMMDANPVTTLSQARMAEFGLTHIKGLAYTPEPSDDLQDTPANYYDSDFWNSAFTPMWSSQQNIPGFQENGGPVNGRGDLASFQSLGVNFLHLYDWNAQRDHTSFLNTAASDGISVTVPISNFNIRLPQTGPLPPMIYVYQLENVQSIFNQVYPNWQSGNFTPATGVKMWLVTNEPDYNQYQPAQVTQLIQELVYCEDKAGIPDANRLPIAVPLSYGTEWAGYSNKTPGVAQVEALYNSFNASAPFQAVPDHTNPGQTVAVPALPSNFFTTRFVWAINPIGNLQIDSFLGQRNPNIYAPYNHPVGATVPQIDWNSIPMVFTELGPSSGEKGSNPEKQAQILEEQLATVKWAETTGKSQDPNFDGAMIFQSLDQLVHKTGPDAHYGIETFKNGDFKTITDVPPTPGYSGGNPANNVMWRLDVLEHKPAWAVVKKAFGGQSLKNRRGHH